MQLTVFKLLLPLLLLAIVPTGRAQLGIIVNNSYGNDTLVSNGNLDPRNKFSIACQLCADEGTSVSVFVPNNDGGLVWVNTRWDGILLNSSEVSNTTIPYTQHVACAHNMVMVYGATSSPALANASADAQVHFIHFNFSSGTPVPVVKTTRVYTGMGGIGRKDNGNWSSTSVTAAKMANSFGICTNPPANGVRAVVCRTFDFSIDGELVREDTVHSATATAPRAGLIGLDYSGLRAMTMIDNTHLREFYRRNTSAAWSMSPVKTLALETGVRNDFTMAESDDGSPPIVFNPDVFAFMTTGHSIHGAFQLIPMRWNPQGSPVNSPSTLGAGSVPQAEYLQQVMPSRDRRLLYHSTNNGAGFTTGVSFSSMSQNLQRSNDASGYNLIVFHGRLTPYLAPVYMCPIANVGTAGPQLADRDWVLTINSDNREIVPLHHGMKYYHRPRIDKIHSVYSVPEEPGYVGYRALYHKANITFTVADLGTASEVTLHFHPHTTDRGAGAYRNAMAKVNISAPGTYNTIVDLNDTNALFDIFSVEVNGSRTLYKAAVESRSALVAAVDSAVNPGPVTVKLQVDTHPGYEPHTSDPIHVWVTSSVHRLSTITSAPLDGPVVSVASPAGTPEINYENVISVDSVYAGLASSMYELIFERGAGVRVFRVSNDLFGVNPSTITYLKTVNTTYLDYIAVKRVERPSHHHTVFDPVNEYVFVVLTKETITAYGWNRTTETLSLLDGSASSRLNLTSAPLVGHRVYNHTTIASKVSSDDGGKANVHSFGVVDSSDLHAIQVVYAGENLTPTDQLYAVQCTIILLPNTSHVWNCDTRGSPRPGALITAEVGKPVNFEFITWPENQYYEDWIAYWVADDGLVRLIGDETFRNWRLGTAIPAGAPIEDSTSNHDADSLILHSSTQDIRAIATNFGEMSGDSASFSKAAATAVAGYSEPLAFGNHLCATDMPGYPECLNNRGPVKDVLPLGSNTLVVVHKHEILVWARTDSGSFAGQRGWVLEYSIHFGNGGDTFGNRDNACACLCGPVMTARRVAGYRVVPSNSSSATPSDEATLPGIHILHEGGGMTTIVAERPTVDTSRLGLLHPKPTTIYPRVIHQCPAIDPVALGLVDEDSDMYCGEHRASCPNGIDNTVHRSFVTSLIDLKTPETESHSVATPSRKMTSDAASLTTARLAAAALEDKAHLTTDNAASFAAPNAFHSDFVWSGWVNGTFYFGGKVNTKTASSSSDDGLSAAAIVGIVFGSLIGVFMIGIFVAPKSAAATGNYIRSTVQSFPVLGSRS